MIDPIDLTRTLLAFETINPPGNERLCVDALTGLLLDLGWRPRAFPFGVAGMNLIAEIPGEDATASPLVLTGHIDTVPLGGTLWSVDPFGGKIIDGRLYGRGASDMKAGVAAMIAATTRFLARPMRRGVTLIVTGMEETGCVGASQLLLGNDPAMACASAILVGEPTSNRLVTAHKGCLCIRARFEGVTAHSSMPEQGVNAIYKAARAVGEIERLDLSRFADPLLGAPTVNVGMIDGGLNVNSVPDRASFTVDARTNGAGSSIVLRPLLDASLGDAATDTLIDLAPVATAPDDRFARLVRQVAEGRGTPQSDGGLSVPFYTDASVLQPHFGVPAIILGPGEPDQAHQTDEFCIVDKVLNATEIYADIISAWCEAG